MKHPFPLTHVGDGELLRQNEAIWQQRRRSTAQGLAHLAEIDARRLYLPAAHPSMFSWCVHVLGLSDDEAYDRIRAARVARQFPVLFELLADGRLNLTGICLLAPHLTAGNAEDLLEAAARKTKREIQQLTAARFPRSEMLTMVAGKCGWSERKPVHCTV